MEPFSLSLSLSLPSLLCSSLVSSDGLCLRVSRWSLFHGRMKMKNSPWPRVNLRCRLVSTGPSLLLAPTFFAVFTPAHLALNATADTQSLCLRGRLLNSYGSSSSLSTSDNLECQVARSSGPITNRSTQWLQGLSLDTGIDRVSLLRLGTRYTVHTAHIP
jgi:hypothetical protein